LKIYVTKQIRDKNSNVKKVENDEDAFLDAHETVLSHCTIHPF